MKKRNHWIAGSAFTLAAVAVAIDHTRHRLPQPVAPATQSSTTKKTTPGTTAPADNDESPCSINPCSMNPCSMSPDSDSDR